MTTKTNDTPLVIEDLKLTPITAGNFRPYGTLVADEQVDYENVPNPGVDRLELQAASPRDFEGTAVENEVTHNHHAHDADRVDPMKPAGRRIPHAIGFQFNHV